MSKIFKDTLYFLSGTIFPSLISFISVPIMARYFLPSEYGQNAIIDTSFSYVSIVLFGFISSLVWRFYNEYKNENRISVFWALIFLFIKISCLIILIGIVIIVFIPLDSYIKYMILVKAGALIISSITSIFCIILRLEGDVLFYNIIQCYNSLGSFMLLLFMTKVLKMRNISMYFTGLIIPIPVLFFLLYRNRNIKLIKLQKKECVDSLKVFLSYGGIAIFSTLLQVILDSSDRYMIKYYYDFELTGIYDKLYSISNKIMDVFVSVFTNLFSPYIYKALSDKTYKNLYKQLIPFFCGIFFPLLFYYTIFSKTICSILLPETYVNYSYLLPIISGGYILIMFSSFGELVIKFTKKYYKVTVGFLLSLITNFIINILLIPKIGICGAAIGTAASYLVLLLFFFIVSDLISFKYILFNKARQNFFYLIPFIEYFIFCLYQKYVESNIIYTVILAVIFALFYYIPFGYYFLIKNKDFTKLFEKEVLS